MYFWSTNLCTSSVASLNRIFSSTKITLSQHAFHAARTEYKMLPACTWGRGRGADCFVFKSSIQVSQTGHMVLTYGHTRATLHSSLHQQTSCLSYDSTRHFILITHIIKTVRNCNLHWNYCSVEEVIQKLDLSPALLSIRWQLFPFYGINGPQNVWKLFRNSRLRSSVWLSMRYCAHTYR